MTLETRLLLGLSLAVVLVYAFTPVAIRLASRFDFHDHPIGYKGHARPTPYLGGAAVMSGFVLALLLVTGDWGRTAPLVGGVVVLWIVGTLDDRRHVSPLARVGVELALAGVLWGAGLAWELGRGPALDLAVTAFWIVAVVNAFNLFDNMDGAASSMAAVASAGLTLLGVVEGDTWLAVSAAVLCGACTGFLPHNLSSPARIFLGDGGSMPLGFAVATLAMAGVKGSAAEWQSLAMGLLFVGVPALDTALVVISRRRRGISILTGGRDHLTHRTRRRLQTARAVAVALGGAQALISALAVVALNGGPGVIVVAVSLYLLVAGATIVVLDTRLAAEPEEPVAEPPEAAALRRRTPEVAAVAVLLPVAIAIGLSPFFFGFYSSRIWAPAGVVLVVLAAAAVMAVPPRLERPSRLALVGIFGLGLWSLTSTLWSSSIEQAVVDANRWLVYGVLLTLLLTLVRSRAAARAALLAVAAVAVIVAGDVLVRMLDGDQNVFLHGRLDAPLGYINGQGSFFLIAFWPCLAAAELRRPLLSGLGAAAATLLACLMVLSQSRGIALAMAVTILIALAVLPGRLTRAWVLVLVATAVAAAGRWLLDVYAAGSDGPLERAMLADAAVAVLAVSLLAGVVWGVACLLLSARRSAPAWQRRVATMPLVAGTAIALALGATGQERLRETARAEFDAFVRLAVEPQGTEAETASSRLVSGAGNRYDYWRVAWRGFGEKPLQGLGAGNYDAYYFRQRSTSEDIRQPHSLVLQVLNETGLIGLLALLALVGGVSWGVSRARAAARRRGDARFVAVAATGSAAAWFVHTNVDWIHLLPGVTAIALLAMAMLLRADHEALPGDPSPQSAGIRPAYVVAFGLVLATAAASLGRQSLAEGYRASAQDALAADPARALEQADRALRLDREALAAYYVKAAALARFNEADAAEAVLLEAARREPDDFVTWALLGDLAVRRDDLRSARRYYGRAAALNPRDPALAPLSRDPRRATSG